MHSFSCSAYFDSWDNWYPPMISKLSTSTLLCSAGISLSPIPVRQWPCLMPLLPWEAEVHVVISGHLPSTLMYTSAPFSGFRVGCILLSRVGYGCHLLGLGHGLAVSFGLDSLSFPLLDLYGFQASTLLSSTQVLFLPVGFLAGNPHLSPVTFSPVGPLRLPFPATYSNAPQKARSAL